MLLTKEVVEQSLIENGWTPYAAEELAERLLARTDRPSLEEFQQMLKDRKIIQKDLK
jgi:hypothetical protein